MMEKETLRNSEIEEIKLDVDRMVENIFQKENAPFYIADLANYINSRSTRSGEEEWNDTFSVGYAVERLLEETSTYGENEDEDSEIIRRKV